MSSATKAVAASSSAVFKVLGTPSKRAWKEVKALAPGSPADEAIRPEDFSEFLLDFVNAPNLLVLAGSGTSLGEKVGGPSMSKLWAAATGLTGFADATKAVQHPAAEQNIESLLSRCKSALQFLSPADKSKVEAFVKDAEDEIYKQCNGFLAKADLTAHQEFLRRLARRSTAKPRLRVFTTNYDRCFEQAAADVGYVVVDGFSYSMPRRYAASFFNYDFVRRDSRQREAPDFVESVFHLLKLHGSVDWDAQDGGIVQNQSPAKRCLIYPAYTKFELSYTQPYLEMMGQFLMALREANTAVLTLGFGFADEHLTQPIRAAVESNTGLRLLVVDRFCEDRAKTSGAFHEYLRIRVESQDDRIALVNADFDQFADHIPNLARMTQEEKLADILRGISKKP